MKRYLSKSGLAAMLGKDVRNLARTPAPDIVIGGWKGWSRSRVRGATVTERHAPPVRLLGLGEVAARLGVTTNAVAKLRKPVGPSQRYPFPQAAACIANARPAPRKQQRGWNGSVYGWTGEDIDAYATATGRVGAGHRGQRGRRPATGNYEELPRCHRPRTDSRHGQGKPCQAVRRKVNGQWAPACGLHLTRNERDKLHI